MTRERRMFWNTHFLPYHNEGHHREVATPDDAATAKKDQSLFSFWITSHFGSYAKAWKIENNRMKRSGKSMFSLSNKMIVYSIANLILVFGIYYYFNFINFQWAPRAKARFWSSSSSLNPNFSSSAFWFSFFVSSISNQRTPESQHSSNRSF